MTMKMNTDNKDFRILVVDDEVEYQRVFSLILSKKGYQVLTCSGGKRALELLSENEIDLIMTDLKMPEMDGLTLVEKVKASYPNIEIMIITAFGSIESAVKAMKYGANGYFIKSNDPESLLVDVQRIAKIKKLEKSNTILQRQKKASSDFFLDSKCPAVLQILETCQKAASSGINVLLLGESGVGKEVFANYIHRLSDRKDYHLIPVNCQVFGEGTVESELFGHEKGSFTGALSRRIGRFEEANHGTLFLDEIGDLPVNFQGKLLRTLETRTIERVGSNRPIELDLRFICATNKDLMKEIAQGRFREDLLYRINTLTITIPPLRERKEDLPGFIQYFLNRICSEQKKKILSVAPETMNALLCYDYPGNVRELRNILERMVALNEGSVLCSQVPFAYETNAVTAADEGMDGIWDRTVPKNFSSLRQERARFEKDYIEQVLRSTGGNVAEAANVMQITKRQLWNKISEYEIERNSL